MTKKIILIVSLALAFNKLFAQDLPKVQTSSMRAPTNIKIDGKTTEWGGKFEAYNPHTELWYTIANDDKNLYLVVQTNNSMVLGRIMLGAIQFIVQPSGQKDDKGAPFISFPKFEKVGPFVAFKDKKESPGDTKQVSDWYADSLMKENNKKLALAKWINTLNMQGVDERLPIFNDQGIQAANAIDIKRTYTCEIAVELSKLKLTSNKFSYHIMVSGGPNKRPPISATAAPDPITGQMTPQNFIDDINQIGIQLSATTDFWGEYTLAK